MIQADLLMAINENGEASISWKQTGFMDLGYREHFTTGASSI